MAKVEFCKPYFEKAFPFLDLSKFSDFALGAAWHTAVIFVGKDDANSFGHSRLSEGLLSAWICSILP